MFDSKGRNIHYLRLSVTDLCNLRRRLYAVLRRLNLNIPILHRI